MTRKWFLSLIGLGAAGQTPIPMSTIKPLRGKPANGECPVCGTMAESYVLSTAPQMFYDKVLGAWIDMGIPIQHPTRYATCAHCQVVFKQEAEEAK